MCVELGFRAHWSGGEQWSSWRYHGQVASTRLTQRTRIKCSSGRHHGQQQCQSREEHCNMHLGISLKSSCQIKPGNRCPHHVPISAGHYALFVSDVLSTCHTGHPEIRLGCLISCSCKSVICIRMYCTSCRRAYTGPAYEFVLTHYGRLLMVTDKVCAISCWRGRQSRGWTCTCAAALLTPRRVYRV